MNNNWRTDRPTKEGTYIVTLEYPEIMNNKLTGKTEREVEIRAFLKRENAGIWIMDDEDTNSDLVWTQQSGSWYGEKVIAWMPLPEIYNK